MRKVREKAEFRGGGTHDCVALAEFLSGVFASMAERPRAIAATVDLRGAGELSLDLKDGEIEVSGADGERARRDFRRRWLAEHPVPLKLGGRTELKMEPAGGGRTRVSK
ncbi:MAG: hypothetical protein ILO34_07140 [Kiritimatiellae bacterium]|nr:hypothetical protein [Kiritimatiellia bacterium]